MMRVWAGDEGDDDQFVFYLLPLLLRYFSSLVVVAWC